MYTRPALPPLLPAERGGREERERDVEIRIKRNCTFRPRGRKEKEGRTRFRLANANRFENPSETVTVSGPPFFFLLRFTISSLSLFHFPANERKKSTVFLRDTFFFFLLLVSRIDGSFEIRSDSSGA